MLSRKVSKTIFVLLIFVSVTVKGKSDHVNLSDFPSLKRWEVATVDKEHEGRIGRKYKSIDNEFKRSQDWEAKPDVTTYDVSIGEEAATVNKDLHNPRTFLESSGRKMLENNLSKKSVTRASTKSRNVNKTIVGKSKRRRLIALKPFLTKTLNTKKRSRRSIDDFDEIMYDFNIGDENDRNNDEFVFKNGNIEDSEEEESISANDHYKAGNFLNTKSGGNFENEIRLKRAINDLGNAIKKAKMLQSKVQSSNEERKGNKKTLIEPHETNLVKIVKLKQSRPNHITNNKVSKRTTISPETVAVIRNALNSNKRKIDHEQQQTGTEAIQKKNTIQIQKSFFPAGTTAKVRHIVPQRSTIPQKPHVEVKLVPKERIEKLMSMETLTPDATLSQEPQKSQPHLTEDPVSRQHISHPAESKENPGINTANVARAVAVAMEQLKRDQMWGKVFVHVRPSGELKVMVQETRKMNGTGEN